MEIRSITPKSIQNIYGQTNKVNSKQDRLGLYKNLDSFEISDNSVMVANALAKCKSEIIQEIQNVDMEKVLMIKKQIESGEYNITGQDVVNRLNMEQ